MEVGTCGDRQLVLAALRKQFAASLKVSKSGRNNSGSCFPPAGDVATTGVGCNGNDQQQLLALFTKAMNHFTPEELCLQFKEYLLFTAQIAEELVQEIRRRAGSDNTREAARAVYSFLRAEPPDSRGWQLLTAVIFISNSGAPKVFECLCKTLLPNTLIKVSYLFMDLPETDDPEEAAHRRRLYDSLVMLLMNLCAQPQVAEELIQKDDLFLLFIGASSRSPSPANIWRNANFTFLCSLVAKALTPPVLKYIHSKRCIAHYLANIGTVDDQEEQSVLLCNLLDLLRSSADNSQRLVDDFGTANGFHFIVEFCTRGSLKNAEQVLSALTNLISSGDHTVHFQIPQQNATAHFHSQKLAPAVALSAGTVRCMAGFKVLEQCFVEGQDPLCLLALEKIGQLFRAERMNYFIVDESSSLFLVTEAMMAKGVAVQEKVLELVETVLRTLNYVPYKEIASLNLHLKNSVAAADWETMGRLLHFFLKIISINATLRDAFRELLILETFLHIVQNFSFSPADCISPSASAVPSSQCNRVVQLCMDLLLNATKGNVLNAQFITENMDVRIVKTLMLGQSLEEEGNDAQQQVEELRTSIALLVKQLLYLAKNEQLFSSILQLLFSEPENLELCTVILKLFTSVLLESHKVRIMFRRSGGYICLMTLLLHLEGLLAVDAGHQRTTTTTTTLSYIALIFHVLTISMRFEPSNAKYFQSEVRPSMVNSILRNLGCFSSRTKVDARQPVWGTFNLETCDSKLRAIHEYFRLGPAGIEERRKCDNNPGDSCQIPADIFSALFILRLLFDLAIDLYEKPSNDLRWAAADELLRNQENLETVPPVSWDGSTVLAHPGPVLSILQLLPSIGGCSPSIDGQGEESSTAMGEEASGDQPSQANMITTNGALDQWAASAQLYAALLLKAILRVERNQQVMCQFDMPAKVLDVGEELFKLESHPLLFSFHYFFERLAYQSLHPSELRHFLRLDQPLCCTNLDDDDDGPKADETSDRRKPGGPIPIHRIKAFVSMLAPRNHAFVHCPGFVEFDMAIEGFCSLLVPSLSRGPRPPNGGGHQQSPVAADGQSNFNPTAGFTLAMWFCIADFSPTATKTSPICLFSIVRALEAAEAGSQFYGHQLAASIENHQTCFQVLLQRTDFCWTLTISAAEHSVADELRKDFGRAPELCLQVPLSEQFFPPLQWAHLAIVISRPASLLKASGTAGVEVFVNGRSLASQKLAFPWLGGESAAVGQQPALHAYIGTLPFFRRPSQLRWRLASLYLIEEAVAVEVVRKMVALGAAYLGNLQSSSPADTSPLVAEKKIILSLNTAATSETNAQMLRSMTATRTDVELVATLLGISPNDQSTPLRMLWNMAALNGMSQRSVPLGAVLVGYLGIRTFVPCPVSALLDSMGGLLPLFGLVAMSSDSSGLYASLKVLVSAMHTNDSIAGDMRRQRGFQTLAILLEEKAPLMNSHIVHLVLTLAGTVDDGSREHLSIPCLQTFEDLLCDLDVWKKAPDEVWKLLMEHFFELIVEGSEGENLRTIRQSALLPRLFIYLIENRTLFPIRNDIAFLLVGAIVQFPCEDQSLLRLGQTISATVAFDMDETGYPFHIAELEKLLLLQEQNAIVNDIEGKQEAKEEVKEAQLYAVYVRNRLLNILCTMLANSNAQMNSQLSAMVVKVLGFGWILALCGPRVHKGTLFMAVRILTNLLRYPQLVDKFRGGSANGGWLSDADSVIRNRAAVLLGFSVANQAGAVGDHVDINPELDKCSGFASLEHVAYAHADKPLVYLALLAVLFQQQRANVQPLEDFTVEAIWSNVFALGEQSSVVDAIERSQFCADAVVSLLATIRAALHKQFELGNAVNEDPKHWATNYPLRLLQLFTFLYQNSAQFFAICHTEAFVVALFSSLLPPNSATPQTPVSAKAPAESLPWTAEGQEAESDGNGVAADSMAPANRCVRQCLELLTNILLNDLCLANESRTEPLFDAIIEFMDCGGGGPVGHSKQGQLFTELVNACLDHFMASKMFFSSTANAAPLIVPPNARSRLNQSSEQTSTNAVRFLSRVIDTVWNCLYKGNPIRILKCFLKLLAETHASNKAAAQLQCTDAHVASLFRLILYLLSRPIDNVDTQMSVLDTLAEIVRNQHLFLTPKSTVDPLFYAALVHLVFMLSDRPQFDLQDPRNRQLERGTAQVSMCAQSVWGILWQQKKAALEDWFRKGELDLDLFSVRAKCDTEANKAWLQFVDSQTDGSYSLLHQDSSSSGRLLAAQKMLPQQLQTRLSRVVARSGIRRLRKSATEGGGGNSVVAGQQQWLAPLLRFDDERLRVEPETFYMWIRVHISLLRELVRSQCQRYHEWHAHVRKWCMQEWHSAEAELTRERGLWGPDRGSRLDKFQLDVTEGPCRIRRKLVPNPAFYLHYPYRPHLDAPEAKPLRAKVAISFDSKLFYERRAAKRLETMDERGIVDWQIGQMLPPNPVAVDQQQLAAIESSAELNMSMIRRMVQKNLELNERQKLTAKAENSTSIEEEAAIEEEEEEEEETEAADEDTKVEEESAAGNVREQRGRSRTTRSASAGASVEEGPKSGEEAEQQRQRTQPQQDQQQPPKKRRDFSVGVAETAGQGPDNQTLLRLLEQGEQLHSMFRCARVQGLDTMEGLLLFGKDHFYVVDGFTLLKTREIRDLDFLPEQFHDPIIPYIAMGCQSRPQSTKTNRQCNKFAYDDIKEVHKRRYLLQQIALEVFSADGRNFLLAFPRKVRDRVYQKLLTMAKRASSEVAQFMKEQKRLRPTDTGGGMAGGPIAVAAGSQLLSQLLQAGGHGQQQSITHKWQRGELSNFDYLMALNTLAGRSYNDLSQYPVFPWVLADYDSEHLDLTKASSFRDLSKPMGAQSPERLADFLKRYREWDDPGGTPPYMYGTHYSSAMIVLSYLVRLEPFTQQFLKLQGGHFDLADRMFHSVRDAYWSAARNNMADVKELIPEFFYLPELLLNANRFDFGIKQSGQRVDHVQVPRWAHGDVHEFVRLHRQALECDYVSEHLHEWIDLIFGYKQTGDPAREAHNVFHHLFYETSVDVEAIEDPLQRNATLGFINNFGQIPAQLFKKPHPQRKVQPTPQGQQQLAAANVSAAGLCQVVPGVHTARLFYHAPEQLRASPRPVKELRTAVGEIFVNEKGSQVVVLEQNRVFIAPGSFLAWGFHDRSVRFGAVGQDKSTVSLLETNDVYEITCMASTDGRQVFAGLSTGTILVWSLLSTSSASSSTSTNRQTQTPRLVPKKTLVGHSDVITALAASGAHNLLVSGSRDRTAILWHLSRLEFIRQLPGPHPGPVTAVAINEAKGDIATASGPWLFLWTVNGIPLAVVNTLLDSGIFSNASSLCLCLGFSTANDWDPNNIILCGTSDGLVKMYSCERMAQRPNAEHQQQPQLSPNSSCPSPAASDGLAIRDHLLRRSQRIQQHHSHHYSQPPLSSSSRSARQPKSSDSQASVESQASSPMHGGMPASSVASSSFSRQSSAQQPKTPTQQHHQQQAQAVPPGMEAVQWIRTLRLSRRILSEHTAFAAGNAQPAPITAVRPTKDHRSLLVGDGIGRIWMWTTGAGDPASSSETH